MGLYERDYTREQFRSQFQHAPQMRVGIPRMTPVVKWLLILNIAIFIGGAVIAPLGNFLYSTFAVRPVDWVRSLQLWRLIGYQFLHGYPMHIFFNMLALFFLGPVLEKHWGSKRFLTFYLCCGAAGGIFYTFLVAVGFLQALPMVGASGAILGLLAACAILFPHFVVIIVLFPVPIRVAAIGLALLYLVTVVTAGENAGGDAAHLAGMATGAIYVFSGPWRQKWKQKTQGRRKDKLYMRERDLQAEVDQVLEKVHNYGIHSLSHREKKLLKRATEAEQKQAGSRW